LALNSNEVVEEGGRLDRHAKFYTVEDYLRWVAANPDKVAK
jgi:hypothetical protein